MENDEKRQRAYHEASHAVVGYCLGWNIDYMDLSATRITRDDYDSKIPLEQNPPSRLWERAVIACAGESGPTIVARVAPNHPQAEDHAARDRYLEAWQTATGSSELLVDLVSRAEQEARDILLQNRTEVGVFARFIERGAVEGDQAREIIERIKTTLVEISQYTPTETPISDQLWEMIIEATVPQIQALLTDGLDVDTRGEWGETLLILAAQYQRGDIVRLLLELGANVNFQSDEGYTALHHAVEEGDYDVVNQLLDAGADMSIYGGGDCGTALHKAARRQDVALVKLLLDRGADPNAPDCDGDTATYLQQLFAPQRPPELTQQILDLLKQAGAR